MSLWLISLKHLKERSPQQRTTKIIPVFCQRTSFCIRHKASYSVEMAVVVPLLTGFLVTILFFFRILQVQCCVEEALLYAGRKVAVESSVVESDEVLFLSAEAFFIEALKENPIVEKYVEHGVFGIQLWQSRFDKELLCLKAKYTIKIPVLFWNIGALTFTSQNCARRWNVSHYEKENVNYVYITPTGEVYHATTSCRVLDLTIYTADSEEIAMLRGKNGQKYYKCIRCDDNENKNGKVYYTDYGTRFHTDLFCSTLKRTIDKISIEDIETRRPCSYCY